MPLFLEYGVLLIYAGIGPVNWIGAGIGGYLIRQKLDLLSKRLYSLPDPAPAVSIVIPAKNEGEPVRRCVLAALAQDYADFEVLVVNDRSTDSTGRILDELARQHADRLRVVHITENPPPGWTGKCNALHRAVPVARGRWLLFIDSDVTLHPDALRITLGYAIHRRHEMVSLILKVTDRSFADALLTPVAGSTMFSLYSIPNSNRDSRIDNAFANGQYILIRRDAYEAVGGHESVRDAFSEDVALARLVKRKGYRPRTSFGEKYAAVRMYTTLAAGIRGWSRNFFGMCGGNPRSLWVATFFVLAGFFSLYPALVWGGYRYLHPVDAYLGPAWLISAALHWLIMTIVLSLIYGWSNCPRRLGLLSPISGVLLLVIYAKALRLCVTRKVTWRGDNYSHPTH